jgi:hypothetical protein
MKKTKLKKERHHHICTKCCNNNLNGLVMKELRVKALNSIKKMKDSIMKDILMGTNERHFYRDKALQIHFHYTPEKA